MQYLFAKSLDLLVAFLSQVAVPLHEDILKVICVKIIQELHLLLEQLGLVLIPSHLFIDLSKEVRWYKCFEHSTRVNT